MPHPPNLAVIHGWKKEDPRSLRRTKDAFSKKEDVNHTRSAKEDNVKTTRGRTWWKIFLESFGIKTKKYPKVAYIWVNNM